jgi:superkiller protein 3
VLVLALALLSAAASQSGQKALNALVEAHRARPGDANLCLQIGVLYTQAQQLDKAEEFYRKALAIDPALLPARKNLATVLWFLNRRTESEREFRTVGRLRPDDPVPHLYLGLAASDRKQYAPAKAHFEKAGPLAVDNPEVLPAVLQAFLAVKDFSLVDRLLARPSTSRPAEVWLLIAAACDEHHVPEKAYAAYQRAIEADPRSEQGYLSLAQFAAAHRNVPFAEKVVARGLEAAPGSPRLLLQRGIFRAREGDRKRAAESFEQAAAADPKSNTAVLALGILQLESGQPAEAAATFRKAAGIAPRDHRAEYLYATALSRAGASDTARRAEIVVALKRALALNPSDARAHVLLGQEYLSSGEIAAGVAQLERALQLDPANTTALYQLGVHYRRQGRTAESRRLLDTFRELKAKEREEESMVVQIMKVVGADAPAR